VHRHTLNTSYLETARFMGQYFLGHMPANGVVPWDFNAPLVQNGVPRPADSSAAMIATAGMLLLAHQEEIIGNASGRAWWAAQAMNVRRSSGENKGVGLTGRVAVLQQRSVRVEADVVKPARERDGEQPGAKQPDRHHLRCDTLRAV
jgi:hypothetical protein